MGYDYFRENWTEIDYNKDFDYKEKNYLLLDFVIYGIFAVMLMLTGALLLYTFPEFEPIIKSISEFITGLD